jgi:hypothetical protein
VRARCAIAVPLISTLDCIGRPFEKDEANVQFKKVQRAEDGKRAMSEYESATAAVRTKTARLKALRLARDAADAAAAAAQPASAKKKPAKKKKKS